MTGEGKSDEAEGENSNKENGAQYDQITVGHITANVLSVSDIQKSHQQDETTSEQPKTIQKRKWWHLQKWPWATIGILFTALGTVGLAVFAFLAWREAIIGTRIARNQLIFGQRASVYFVVGINRDRKDKTAYGVDIAIINGGNTPTKNLRIDYGCLKQEKGPVSNPFNIKWDERKTASLFLGPKQSDIVQACIVKTNEIDKIINDKISKFVFAEARYEDVLAEITTPRKTRLARRVFFDSNGQSSTRVVGNNNCADNECP